MQRSYLGKVSQQSRPSEVTYSGPSGREAGRPIIPGTGPPLSRPSIDARSLKSLWAPRASTETLNQVSGHVPSYATSPLEFLRQPISANLVQAHPTVSVDHGAQRALLHPPESQIPVLQRQAHLQQPPRHSQGTRDIIQEILANPPPEPPKIRKRRYKKRVSAGPPRSNSRGDLGMIEEDMEMVTWANAWDLHAPSRTSLMSVPNGRAEKRKQTKLPKSAPKSVVPRPQEATRRHKKGPKSAPKTLKGIGGNRQVRSPRDQSSPAATRPIFVQEAVRQAQAKAHDAVSRPTSSVTLPFRLSTQENASYHGLVVAPFPVQRPSMLHRVPLQERPKGSNQRQANSGTSNILASGQILSSRYKPQVDPGSSSLSSASLISEISTTSSTSTSSSLSKARRSKKLAEFEIMQFQAAVLTSCATRSLGPSMDEEWREKKNKMERMAKYAQVVRARMIEQQKAKTRS